MKKIKLLALLSVLISSTVYSDIKLDSSKLQNTKIEQGKRGNTIININTPNGKGISVNDFENFQTKNGVIFNNSGQRMNISQLEGVINGNPNITGDQAKLILNRVNGANRTEIEGAMEAVGRNKVDMIFSSPNGIYLDGAKFIGFKDVTFTTAPVNLDGDGNIQTLTIDKGNIEVGRKGLDASKLEQLALLSKKISIDGSVKSKNIDIISGKFDYNVNDKSYVSKEVENKSIFISSSEFGSIYGDQINIIATNGGIGIKGDIIANDTVLIGEYSGDFWSKFRIDGNIKADNKITIDVDGITKFYGDIETENLLYKQHNGSRMELYGNTRVDTITAVLVDNSLWNGLFNHGNLVVDTLYLNIPFFVNYGNFLASNVFFFGENGGHFTNDGVALVSNNIEDLTFNRRLSHVINIKNSELTVGGNIIVNQFKNEGIINIPYGYLDVDQLWNYKNGQITVEGNIIFGDFLNTEGSVITAENIYGRGVNFYNKGTLEAKNMNVNYSNRFINYGILNIKENIEIKALKIENSGELNTKNLKLIFKDFSSQAGKITADKITFENYPE